MVLLSVVLWDFDAKTHWGLNHGVGISADLWRYPLAQIQSLITTNRAEPSPCGSARRGSRDKAPVRTAPSN